MRATCSACGDTTVVVRAKGGGLVAATPDGVTSGLGTAWEVFCGNGHGYVAVAGATLTIRQTGNGVGEATAAVMLDPEGER